MARSTAHQQGGSRSLGAVGGGAPPDVPPGTTATGGDGDLDNAIAVLRARVDEEFRITERLDSKSRQAFALATGFFAVVQAVAFGALAQSSVNGGEKAVLLTATVLAGLSVLNVAHRLANGEETLEEADVKPEAIAGWFGEAGAEPGSVSRHLVIELSVMARARTDNNTIRATNYGKVAAAMRLSLILTGVELVAAISVRI